MAGILSGLESLGLGNLENSDLYGKEKEKTVARAAANVVQHKEIAETDIIYTKDFICPVCDKKFSSKVMKYGKAKLLGTDPDLKPRYQELESVKYDVLLCPKCGYGALMRYFPNVLEPQKKLIKEMISSRVKLNEYTGETVSFEEAMERYKMSLACAIVKKAKPSEKAFICLKTAWLLRGWRESLEAEGDRGRSESFLEQEMEFIKNAYSGFVDARLKEPFPIVGMDTYTYDYLLAQLAMKVGDFDSSKKFVSTLITSRDCPDRIKDKARDLKEQLRTIESLED